MPNKICCIHVLLHFVLKMIQKSKPSCVQHFCWKLPPVSKSDKSRYEVSVVSVDVQVGIYCVVGGKDINCVTSFGIKGGLC